MEKRFFTVEEARQLLPSLKELMGQVMVISHRLEEYREVVQELADSASSNTGGPEGTAYLNIVISLQSCLTQLQETAAIMAQRSGKGSIILFADNLNFRAFWYGTNGLFLNAIFLGQTF